MKKLEEVNSKAVQEIGVYRLSWWLFLKSALIIFVVVMLGMAILIEITRNFGYGDSWAIIICCLIFLALISLKFLSLRSVILYADKDGVWVFSGIFPWSKGSWGVKWRDVDSASTRLGFFSWLVRGYDVHVSHRFTKGNEIRLGYVHNGFQFVDNMNDYLTQQHVQVDTIIKSVE